MESKEHVKNVQSSVKPLFTNSLNGIGIFPLFPLFPYAGLLRSRNEKKSVGVQTDTVKTKNVGIETDILVEIRLERDKKTVGMQTDLDDIIDTEWFVVKE